MIQIINYYIHLMKILKQMDTKIFYIEIFIYVFIIIQTIISIYITYNYF